MSSILTDFSTVWSQRKETRWMFCGFLNEPNNFWRPEGESHINQTWPDWFVLSNDPRFGRFLHIRKQYNEYQVSYQIICSSSCTRYHFLNAKIKSKLGKVSCTSEITKSQCPSIFCRSLQNFFSFEVIDLSPLSGGARLRTK